MPRGSRPGERRGGRAKGTPNKATQAVRAAFSGFVENNVGKAQALFDQVAADNPAKALELLARLAEFVIPKQTRTEIEGELGMTGKLVIRE